MRSRDVGEWLATQGITVPIYYDGQVLTDVTEDRCLVITATGGPGESFERAFDALTYQVLSRGSQGTPSHAAMTAEDLAWQTDDLLMDVIAPVEVGEHFVNLISRVGSPPRLLDVDASRRRTFTCNYLLQVAR